MRRRGEADLGDPIPDDSLRDQWDDFEMPRGYYNYGRPDTIDRTECEQADAEIARLRAALGQTQAALGRTQAAHAYEYAYADALEINAAEIGDYVIGLESAVARAQNTNVQMIEQVAQRDAAYRARLAAEDVEHRAQLAAKDAECRAQLAAKDAECRAQLAAKDAEHRVQLAAKDAEYGVQLSAKGAELAAKDTEIAKKGAEIAAKDAEIAAKDAEIAALRPASPGNEDR
jgi:hypothetical protein